ncbi:hypothetical protein D3C78_922430 [compost metagenome]
MLSAHIALYMLAHHVRSRISVSAFQIINDPFKWHICFLAMPEIILVEETNTLAARSIQQLVHLLVSQLRYGAILRYAIVLANRA